MWSRRTTLKAFTTLAALGLVPRPALARTADAPPALGEPRPFSFADLIDRARTAASHPYRTPDRPAPELIDAIDYDAYRRLDFDLTRSLWQDGPRRDPVALFHLHRWVPLPVTINLVENGEARRVFYDPTVFDYSGDLEPGDLPADLGYAGFRLLYRDEPDRDWLAFMGASYFRAAGPLDQYGLSARGIAVNTVMPGRTEEFPRFTEFWLEQDETNASTIYAVLDGASVTGAYRFVVERASTVMMTVAARIFTRRTVDRLGIAPLTSMFWFSETNRHGATDWRPEVHDSDGLAIWTGSGERIWRPLYNPAGVRTSSFVDVDPQGFGLFQRDRDFASYQDDSVFYERRPSAWIEPLHPWGQGAVQLAELPTDDEIHDNIVAYWTTDRPVSAGEALSFDYRLHWLVEPVFGHSPVGRVAATRIGRAGVPGQDRPALGNKVVVDFVGGQLDRFQSTDDVEPVIDASSARIADAYALRVVDTNVWRLVFDVFSESTAPVELRCYLRHGDEPLTETWLYLHTPVSFG